MKREVKAFESISDLWEEIGKLKKANAKTIQF
jgi:hypothetical protein